MCVVLWCGFQLHTHKSQLVISSTQHQVEAQFSLLTSFMEQVIFFCPYTVESRSGATSLPLTSINRGFASILNGHIHPHFKIIFKIEVQLIYNVYQFQVYSKVIQEYIFRIYIYITFQILFHYRFSQDIEYSSLCYTVGLCCLSILYIVLCMVNPKLLIYPSPLLCYALW